MHTNKVSDRRPYTICAECIYIARRKLFAALHKAHRANGKITHK